MLCHAEVSNCLQLSQLHCYMLTTFYAMLCVCLLIDKLSIMLSIYLTIILSINLSFDDDALNVLCKLCKKMKFFAIVFVFCKKKLFYLKIVVFVIVFSFKIEFLENIVFNIFFSVCYRFFLILKFYFFYKFS